MKSSSQFSKSTPSTSSCNSKNKKSSKDREKRKSQTSQSENNGSNEKESPNKESGSGQYAGIGAESILNYAEHLSEDISSAIIDDMNKSEEICNVLAEDINYKLRYIIHDALLKAKLSGRDKINSKDIEETFETLHIEKVYGAPTSPNWLTLPDQPGTVNTLYLEDAKINLIELAEEEASYIQPGKPIITKTWYPEEVSSTLKEYFTIVCQSIISSDPDIRAAALEDISENSNIGPIIEWFYHFGYFLLSKDITYDCLTLRALDLIDTLESSPLGSANVSEKQLKLLVRLILQRLLQSVTTEEVLKPMCSLLSILCLRVPIKEFVIKKIKQKINEIPGLCENFCLPILTTVYYLGVDAIMEIFLPNLNFFIEQVMEKRNKDLTQIMLGIYNIICRTGLYDSSVHELFFKAFEDVLVMFWRPIHNQNNDCTKEEPNFIRMKAELIKTRKKIQYTPKGSYSYTDLTELMSPRQGASFTHKKSHNVEEVFDLPTKDCPVKRILDQQRSSFKYYGNETHVTIGKTTLLLPVLTYFKNKKRPKCAGHSLLSYNI